MIELDVLTQSFLNCSDDFGPGINCEETPTFQNQTLEDKCSFTIIAFAHLSFIILSSGDGRKTHIHD